MRALLWVALGLIVGIGIGWVLGGERASRHRSVRSEANREGRAIFEPGARNAKRPAPEHAPDSAPSPAPHSPSSARDADDTPLNAAPPMLGTLIVECDGKRVTIDDFSVSAMDMWGDEGEASPEEIDDETSLSVTYRLWPGEATVYWYDEEDRRIRVRIAAGKTVVVRTDGPRAQDEDPIPPRLGRLTVWMYDRSGKPVADGGFDITGPGPSGIMEDSTEVDGTGRTTLDLRPGRYRLTAGSQFHDVTVRAQQTERVEFRYENEGEIEFETYAKGSCQLVRAGDGEFAPHAYQYAGNTWRLLYVTPGTYELLVHFTGEARSRNLGPVLVSARMTTKFDPKLPSGNVTVVLRGDETPTLYKAQLIALDATGPPASVKTRPVSVKSAGHWRAELRYWHLPAGTWRLTYAPEGFVPVTRDIEVDDKPVEVTIDLVPR